MRAEPVISPLLRWLVEDQDTAGSLMNTTSLTAKDYALLHDIVLVLSLVILVNTHARRIRSVAATMADTLSPKTPKKLFKPSSKTKTTPVNKQRPTSSLSNSAPAPSSSAQRPQQQQQQSRKLDWPSFSSARSTVSSVSQSTESLRRLSPDDIFKTTNLAPLTDSAAAASGRFSDLASSDTASEPPIGLIDHEAVTPTKLSRSANLPPRHTPDSQKGSTPSAKKQLFRAKSSAKKVPIHRAMPEKSQDALKVIENLPGAESIPADKLNSPTDLAKYFEEQGHPEMSQFVNALLGNTPASPSAESDSTTTESTNKMSGALKSVSPNPMEELPKDDNLVAESNERTKKAVANTKDEATNKAGRANDAIKSGLGGASKGFASSRGKQGVPSLNQPKSADISKTAEGAGKNAKQNVSGAAPTNKFGAPDAKKISQTAKPAVSNPSGQLGNQSRAIPDRSISHSSFTSGYSSLSRGSLTSDGQSAARSPTPVGADGTRMVDNMGKPAHIQRTIDIPFQKPQKMVGSQPENNQAADGLGDPSQLPSTDNLRGTHDLPSLNDLPEIPDDDSQDPPEEVLDPSVHSSSTSITPIPKIPKIAPIDSAPPADLARMAEGLAGFTVDDVGNIVDEDGEVLGHATGDLPSMVGRKVSEDGEIYGDEGEIIGYVSENFVNPPQPTEIPSEVLGGLKVDHEGNILDAGGNVIGKFHQKPGPNGSLPPFMQQQQNEEKPKEEQKPKVNAHTGGSPSDIFLDVKSTTDGIQLTIRIPTTFSKPPHSE